MRHFSAGSWQLGLACLLGALALSPDRATAQERALRGMIADSAGAPLDEATVAIVALHLATRTDKRGRFSFDKVALGDIELLVRRIGYEPRTVKMTVRAESGDSLRIVLTEAPEVLSAINVSATERHRRQMVEDFYLRRARGIGKFVTREEIRAGRNSTPSDVFRGTPGIRVVRTIAGTGIRFNAIQTLRNTQCVPLIWLDGQRSPGMEIDEISIDDIEGIELYTGNSTTPPQFWNGTTIHCGTIVIWTRVPGTP